jgi:hypothetical protein
LSAAGLRHFIARDLDDYVDLAVAKASDFAALAPLVVRARSNDGFRATAM